MGERRRPGHKCGYFFSFPVPNPLSRNDNWGFPFEDGLVRELGRLWCVSLANERGVKDPVWEGPEVVRLSCVSLLRGGFHCIVLRWVEPVVALGDVSRLFLGAQCCASSACPGTSYRLQGPIPEEDEKPAVLVNTCKLLGPSANAIRFDGFQDTEAT